MVSASRQPCPGASLLLAFTPRHSQTDRSTVVVFGSGKLAANRILQCREAGYSVVLALDEEGEIILDDEVRAHLENGAISSLRLTLSTFAIYFDTNLEFANSIAFVLVTDTLISPTGKRARSASSAAVLSQECHKRRIPMNFADLPQLSDFTFPSTYRFPLNGNVQTEEQGSSPLQIAITTNASSCRLASRIRRHMVASLPATVGAAVARVHQLRELAKAKAGFPPEEPLESSWMPQHINKAVKQRKPYFNSLASIIGTPPDTPPLTPLAENTSFHLPSESSPLDTASRMRFIAQLSEYWPFDALAKITDAEALSLLELQESGDTTSSANTSKAVNGDLLPKSATENTKPQRRCSRGNVDNQEIDSRHALSLVPPRLQKNAARGRIFLVGSGPGSPQLLTRAAYTLLTSEATLILSDKLVPDQILALIPKHIPLIIAKKFPGNAEGAQSELIRLALEGAQKGETVVRLKQGDVYLYGRGGEEVLQFRQAGFESTVIPGLSSVLAGPTMANIPVTQRGVAESVIVCTGVGRGGKGVSLPGYDRARSTVVLMGVARIAGVVQALTSNSGQEGNGREGGNRDGPAYPLHLPIAIIERASSPDQRVISSTLENIVQVLEELEEQRPPAMMVIGWSVLCLAGAGDVSVLDGVADEKVDRERVGKWLGNRKAIVTEGLTADAFL